MTKKPLEEYIIVDLSGNIRADTCYEVAYKISQIGTFSSAKEASQTIKLNNMYDCSIYKITKIEAELVRENGHRARQRKLGNNASR